MLGPISGERLEALVERCDLRVGDHVLEVGCGKGDLLVRLLRRWPGATAEGFDRNPWFLADARAAAAAAGEDVVRRVSFIETDLAGALIADRGAAMSIAFGATGVYQGDQAATVRGSAAATRSGGTVLFGDGLWIREPLASGLAAFGMAHDELAEGVDGFAALARGAGLEVIEVEVVSDAEWDAYEAAYATAIASWAGANAEDPEREAFVARSAAMADSYRAWRRDTFGFAIGRFRVPG
ncbi:MAG: methyltransferase domain-containing protein [Candidatus Limnocylindrales bacterium]